MAKITAMKDATCIDCGKAIQINKVASPKTARCPECKGGGRKIATTASIGSVDATQAQGGQTTVYGESMVGPRIDGAPKPTLAKLACPYHPQKQMDIIGVIKNDHWGDIVSLQCREKGCYTVVQISEQSKMSGPMRTTVCGTQFEPDDVIDHLREGNMDRWCEERGIEQRHTKGL